MRCACGRQPPQAKGVRIYTTGQLQLTRAVPARRVDMRLAAHRASVRARPRQLSAPRLAPHGAPRRLLSTRAASAPAPLPAASASNAEAAQLALARFDLPLAVALAAASFEAYLEPAGADPGLQETLLGGGSVTYTDRAFLTCHYQGLLRLTIHSAAGLKAVNITGGSDPYVVATLGDSAAVTEVRWGDTNPAWRETHTLYVTDRSADLLRLRVLDKNKLVSDVDLGAVVVSVSQLLEQPGAVLDLALRGSNAAGSLRVSAEFLPFSEDLVGAVLPDGQQVPAAPESLGSEQLEAVQQAVAGSVASAAASVAQAMPQVVPSEPAAGSSGQGGGAGSGSSGQGPAKPAPALGEVVQDAKAAALKSLSGALSELEGRLQGSGLADQAAAVAQGKASVVGKVSQAADSVGAFVQREGLAAVPANELAAILGRIAAGRSKTDSSNSSSGSSSSGSGSSSQAETGSSEGASSSGLPALRPEAMPAAWKALASVVGRVIESVFRPVAHIDNRQTDTQVWVHVSDELREVVVAFRGTEQVKWRDLVSDLNLIPTSLDVERTGGVDLGLANLRPFAKFRKNKEVMTHSGFLAAYDSVRPKLLRLVDALTSDASRGRPWRVLCTGHSLGGALATLAAYDLAGRSDRTAAGVVVGMYSYGAPRVGNQAFADAFARRLRGASWRITNSSDIVPSVPRLMGYAHVPTGVRLSSDGRLVIEPGSKDVLGEGREVAEVISELASQAMEVAQGSRALEDVVEAIRDHEMAILNALVDGSALGQHMEDFYLATLKEAVLQADPSLAAPVAAALQQAAAASPPPPEAKA